MEQGSYRRVRRHKQPRPTEQEIGELMALIRGLDPDGAERKVAVIAPISGAGLLRESLGKVLRLPKAFRPAPPRS
ncbi:hypothetical protein [Pseudarthrobacter sulfonivorans]|uniref:hypothetical protein n=1 Tax=Pseudarthrobacter sulfonivorans TaxID=121292 RepID=UPI0028653F72|nr:hypothetical protein [Pseudarthrobacter sulfonivorans]MDR6413337.1 hypothetical protein [Pseudarthrobacter sulfonivorans]